MWHFPHRSRPALYLPEADGNGDGLPEGAPFVTFNATTTDTRLTFGF
jgi:hypothetical protein